MKMFLYIWHPLDLVGKTSHSSSALELFKDGLPTFRFTIRISSFNCLMISLPCTISLTFLYSWSRLYLLFLFSWRCNLSSSMLLQLYKKVLTQCTWRNFNCALGKIRYCLISICFFPMSFQALFKRILLVCLTGFSTTFFHIKHSFILQHLHADLPLHFLFL